METSSSVGKIERGVEFIFEVMRDTEKTLGDYGMVGGPKKH